MKIEFKSGGYIDCKKSDSSDSIIITISAKDHENSLKKITNIAELTADEFKKLISDIKG